jgi:hypothetical protein
MFTAWTAQRPGIKRGGRGDVAEGSYRNRDGTHRRTGGNTASDACLALWSGTFRRQFQLAAIVTLGTAIAIAVVASVIGFAR